MSPLRGLFCAPSLSALHDQLRQLQTQPPVNVADLAHIQHQISATLPRVTPGRALPQKKTPSGRTQVLHMTYSGHRRDRPLHTEQSHLHFFASTAQTLGLRLDILTHGHRGEIEQTLSTLAPSGLTYTLTESPQPVLKWAEDSVEYLINGSIAILTRFPEPLLHWAMTTGRRHRWQDKLSTAHLDAALQDDHLWVPLGVRVNASETGLVHAQIAQAQGQPVNTIRAYIEGGNLITGEDQSGQPILLVGKDAISTTAHLYQLTDQAVRRIICEDFGLERPEQVISVEQPGQFHLDMGLLFIGNGIVILNDSRALLQDAVEMATHVPCLTTEQMAAKLQLQTALEATAAADLETAGLHVIRQQLAHDLQYNFCNGEFVTSADGLDYYLTNGGPPIQEEQFSTLMVQDWHVVHQVLFSPRAAAQQSLQERGGVGCRLKGSRQ